MSYQAESALSDCRNFMNLDSKKVITSDFYWICFSMKLLSCIWCHNKCGSNGENQKEKYLDDLWFGVVIECLWLTFPNKQYKIIYTFKYLFIPKISQSAYWDTNQFEHEIWFSYPNTLGYNMNDCLSRG